MDRFVWHKPEPELEDGVDRGVIFGAGLAVTWPGLIRVDETSNATEVDPIYIDGIPVTRTNPVEEFSAVVEAFTYPDVLENRGFVFGFSYRTHVGYNGSYKLHIVYNATVEVPTEGSSTIDNAWDPNNFIFVLQTTPVRARKVRPFSHLVIDSKELNPNALKAIEDRLYGTKTTTPTLPDPVWLMELLGSWSTGYGHGPYGHGPYGGHK